MTSPSRPGVLLYGYYGCGNLGDDLLLAVLLERLRALMPGAQFFIRDHGDASGVEFIGPDVSLTGIEPILADRSRSKAVRLASYALAYARLLRRCRWLIFGGGTLFHERGSRTSLLLQWMICRLARLLGVRIAALGVGVADLESRLGRWLLRRIVASCELFMVRDEAALRQCAGTSARLTNDLAFSWAEKFRAPPAQQPVRSIGITVHHQALGDAPDDPIQHALAMAVRRWRELGHRVIFLVFQRGSAAHGDESIFLSTMSRFDIKDIEVRVLTADAEAIRRSLMDIDSILGMRFHGLVLAAMQGKPFVGIAYDNKVSEICRAFDMPCIGLGDVSADALIAAFDALGGRSPQPDLIQACKRGADENFDALARLLT